MMCTCRDHSPHDMPELPEVETTVRGLAPVLEGRRIASIEAAARRSAPAVPARPAPAADRRARSPALGRRAKYGLIDTDRGDTLVFHLGMSGRWRIDPAEIGAARPCPDRDRRGQAARAQRSAPVRLARPGARPTRSTLAAPFAAMGPEPLGDGVRRRLSRAGAGRAARRRSRRCCSTSGSSPASATSMSARRSTWRGIAPGTAGGQIARPRLDRLAEAVKAVLLAAIEAGGSTPSRLCPARWRARLFLEAEWRVYGREGAGLSRCGAAIRRRVELGPLDLLTARNASAERLTRAPLAT